MRHEKAEQLLVLARALASSAEGMTLDEMADEIGVGRRTVERMRDRLQSLFPQMEEIADGAAKRFRILGGLDSFFQSPTKEELAALGKVARHLEAAGKRADARALMSLDAKVRGAMKAAALRKVAPDLEALLRAEQIAVQAGPRPSEDPQLLVDLREAICSLRAVEFRHRSPGKHSRTRKVAPYGILFGYRTYLVGPELGSDLVKQWRLDRMSELKMLDDATSPPEAFSLPDFANASFGIFHGDEEDVVLRVRKEGADDFAGWRFHPTQVVEPEPGGGVIVRFRASGMLELAWHLFTWGDKIEILAPPSLRKLMLEQLSKSTARHRASPSPPLKGGRSR
jgi:predicted DNA-binding transcriptional regulator YafY